MVIGMQPMSSATVSGRFWACDSAAAACRRASSLEARNSGSNSSGKLMQIGTTGMTHPSKLVTVARERRPSFAPTGDFPTHESDPTQDTPTQYRQFGSPGQAVLPRTDSDA